MNTIYQAIHAIRVILHQHRVTYKAQGSLRLIHD